MPGAWSLALAMSWVLAVWAGLAAAWIGWGLILQRLFGLREVTAQRLVRAFWTGLALVVLTLQVWHFWRPVDGWALAAVATVGAAGLAANVPPLWRWLRHRAPHGGLTTLVALSALIYLANRAVGPPECYDSGLYQLNAVRWNNSFPVVPGLGNLHARLAFNNSNLLLPALLETGPMRGRSYHFTNGLLLAGLAVSGILGCRNLVRASPRQRAANAMHAALLLYALALALDRDSLNISSPSTDQPVAIVVMVAAALLFEFLAGRGPAPPEQAHQMVVVVGLAALATTFKMSAAAFAAPAGLLAWFVLAARGWRRWRLALGATAGAGLLAAGLLGPWMLRGICLSGYPLFPTTLAPAPVAWRLPAGEVDRTRTTVLHWARSPFWTEDARGWEWLKPWWTRFQQRYRGVLVLLAVAAAAVPAALLGRLARGLARRPPPSSRWTCWLIFPPTVAGAAAWFWLAPDPRFGFYYAVVLAGAAFALALDILPAGRAGRWLAVVGVGGILAVAGVVGVIDLGAQPRISPAPRTRALGWYWYPPGPDGGFHPAVAPTGRAYTTRHGLRVYGPTVRDQCWDAPLPCAPRVDPNLRTRRPGDLASGFVIDPSRRRR